MHARASARAHTCDPRARHCSAAPADGQQTAQQLQQTHDTWHFSISYRGQPAKFAQQRASPISPRAPGRRISAASSSDARDTHKHTLTSPSQHISPHHSSPQAGQLATAAQHRQNTPLTTPSSAAGLSGGDAGHATAGSSSRGTHAICYAMLCYGYCTVCLPCPGPTPEVTVVPVRRAAHQPRKAQKSKILRSLSSRSPPGGTPAQKKVRNAKHTRAKATEPPGAAAGATPRHRPRARRGRPASSQHSQETTAGIPGELAGFESTVARQHATSTCERKTRQRARPPYGRQCYLTDGTRVARGDQPVSGRGRAEGVPPHSAAAGKRHRQPTPTALLRTTSPR